MSTVEHAPVVAEHPTGWLRCSPRDSPNARSDSILGSSVSRPCWFSTWRASRLSPLNDIFAPSQVSDLPPCAATRGRGRGVGGAWGMGVTPAG